MAEATAGPDAELVVEVTVLAGDGSPQDTVELVVRDYVARGHRTGARTAACAVDVKPQDQQG
ncbi:DUF2191 domain-containing protein [Streptomyces atratus]|uniref:DUF2191 domain-containing protein n=1 Tax=Streptomyces atratus TaxID=1893 RepID=UPI00224D4D91|nr:DUF2191 domain-containing protein [Streptomyces atratus]MCX5339601.1 DUF2191 domain-containing protein [Streptomyces atratus]